MIDQTNLKTPGWQRVVQELSAPARDERAFAMRLVAVLGQVAAARQAVLFSIPGSREDDQSLVEPKVEFAWPDEAGTDDAGVRFLRECRDAAREAGATRQVRAFGLDAEGQFYDGSRGTIVAVPLFAGLAQESAALPLRGVATLYLEDRSRQALQTTLALVEVISGYVYAQAAQQGLLRARQAGASLDLATRLIAAMNTTGGFKACALQLTNDLCRQAGVDRAALGMVRGSARGTRDRRSVRLEALSDTENIDRRMEMSRRLEAAMEECLDQQQPVLYPPPADDADAVLARAVTHAHRELASGDARVRVASLPLRVSDRDGERVVGVVTIESGATGPAADAPGGAPADRAPISATMVELLQAALDLVAPVLLVRQSDDRHLALRAKDSALRAGSWLVGPTHTAWKLAGAALLVASIIVTFVRVPYRVGAPMELLPRNPRTISAPFDGVLWTLSDRALAGTRVEAGETLAELDTTALRLSLIEARNDMLRYEKEADEAMKKSDIAQAQQAEFRAEQARSRADRYEHDIARARIVAPIAGTIISGDVRDKVRSAVKLGDPLFQVADVTDMVAVARVEDRDIALIEVGQRGEIAAKSDPARAIPVEVEAIVPLASARDGVNAFEVRARLVPGPGDATLGFRPGVEGQARFTSRRMSLLAIGTRRIIDQARLWLWW